MAELKTQKNNASVADYLATIPGQKGEDAQILLKIFTKATGLEACMWGSSIVGFGSYHYKSERSRQEGDWPLTGFAPRAQSISIYIMPGFGDFQDLLAKLGKHKVSQGSCLYIKKLADIDTEVLELLIVRSVEIMKTRYKV